ncbi:hypothetical protein L204_103794 [Cryptococcus depauperatus]
MSQSPRSSVRVPPSSAKFLQHLHTNPSSHHITISSQPASDSNSSPDSLPFLPAPIVEETSVVNQPTRAYTSSKSPVAGPSSYSTIGRTPSKSARPKTAPSRHEEVVPETDGPDLPPPIPPRGGDHGYLTGDSSCVNLFAHEEGLAETMGMLSVSEDQQNLCLVGRAGSLGGISETRTSKPEPAVSMNWATFAQAYAYGLFDPNKVPNPPIPSDPPADLHSARLSLGQKHLIPSVPSDFHESSSEEYSSKSSGGSGSTATNLSSAPSTSGGSFTTGRSSSMAPSLAAKRKAFELEHLPDRTNEQALRRPDKLSLPSYSLAAATVRMASTSYLDDFAPLSMPSPERELTDPLASVVSSLKSAGNKKDSASSDPGSSRFPLHHSMSNTLGVNTYTGGLRLPTIQASPVSTPLDGPYKLRPREKSPPKARHGLVNSRIPPASAPLEKVAVAETTTDYFGSAVSHDSDSASPTITESTPINVVADPPLKNSLSPVEPQREAQPSLSTETKYPLPQLTHPTDMSAVYEQYGWLPAPVPPDEEERRRALYRFNILHTSADINFNRIAHMAKLVFNPKLVFITLIDSDTQWFKSQSGSGPELSERITSFCAHSILPRSDEPLVVLDALLDWRFENNPNVIGPPHVRFYAGAPLRTADGFNIGSLCIIDDKPRTEFTPRSRFILKEFAGICMREMELWRDKLQLRVRDKIQTSMEKFTRECLEMDTISSSSNVEAATKMDQVYARAAQLVCSTIGLDGCFVLDISQLEMFQTDTPMGKRTLYRANPYHTVEQPSPVLERSESYGPVKPFPVLAAVPQGVDTRTLTPYEHEKLATFLQDHRDGRIFEGVAPLWIRYMFPQVFRYGMAVPIFGVDQQPFAMICAYTARPEKQYLEGYELQFLRAIGVIILSAVLRRRMLLADKTKSILISSVSHELRTPLHGILAAAELLGDTSLDSTQLSFLKTVQTCGNSLIETVNHVLDFTKLSGSQSSKNLPQKLDKINLAALIEQTVEGCWIGQRAKFFMGDADIGSFYAPPISAGVIPKVQRASVGEQLSHVETVIDIDLREKGWNVRCEKGGLRRVLMNLVGNSFKFTKDGYVQVSLRELPHTAGSKIIPIEMAVVDTGKGIGKDFLKDQLFLPFSQENPLQAGTGLGLAIVNSIIQSETVKGKVDVWSAEGVGTEIKVTLEVEVVEDDDADTSTSSNSSVTSSIASTFGHGLSVSFVGFRHEHKGHMLSFEVLVRYANYWHFDVKPQNQGSILIINNDIKVLEECKALHKPIILLSIQRAPYSNVEAITHSGGFCRVVFKPVTPSSLQKALCEAAEWVEEREATGEHDSLGGPPVSVSSGMIGNRPSMSHCSSGVSEQSDSTISDNSHSSYIQTITNNSRLPLQRRRSEENEQTPQRPSMAPRSVTYHHTMGKGNNSSNEIPISSPIQGLESPTSNLSTIPLADGGAMLKAATVSVQTPRIKETVKVMIVEDNLINRRVLGAFLKKKGFEYAEAMDGKAGVDLFENTPLNYWDVILMDISMPVMNGHQATRAIRRIEATRRNNLSRISMVSPSDKSMILSSSKAVQARVKIFALTGLATADDKREAFGSGVDGYLVKPVSLSSLDMIFKKIGF